MNVRAARSSSIQQSVPFVPGSSTFLSTSSSCPLRLSQLYDSRARSRECITVETVLKWGSRTVPVLALIDCGATSDFIDSAFVRLHSIPLRAKSHPIEVTVADGRPLVGGGVSHETIQLTATTCAEFSHRMSFNVIASPNHAVILGMPWLEKQNPDIDWELRRIRPRCHTFNDHRTSHAVRSGDSLPEIGRRKCVPNHVPMRNARLAFAAASISCVEGDPGLDTVHAADEWTLLTHPHMAPCAEPSVRSRPTPAAVSPVALPVKYAQYADVFDKAKADMLPPHRSYDCPINLQPGAEPPFGRIYSLSPREQVALKAYVEENLAKGFIRHSMSPAGAPVLFVKKKDGSLRLCVDYRGLNSVTIKNRYPLPLIDQLLSVLSAARVFTKIDLRGAYNLLRIRAGDEWKTAFRTSHGLFEYTVMPFGLANAPASFQHLMNDTFREQLDQFVVVYLDDILIFSPNQALHDDHVKLVLSKLRAMGLFAKLEKCRFDASEVEFLGYIVTCAGVRMDPAKVDAIVSWQSPRNMPALQIFLGFANYYRKFIRNYSALALPLTRLTQKGVPFVWDRVAESAFRAILDAFTGAPVLCHFDPDRQCIVEVDASDFALGLIISQRGDDGALHPLAFYSRKLLPAEQNYQIHDKELLAVVTAFEKWRHFLDTTRHRTRVLSDHRNLVYFTTSRLLNRRQIRWSQFLAEFDYVIEHRAGSLSGKPDALSRRPEYRMTSDETRACQSSIVLPARCFDAQLAECLTVGHLDSTDASRTTPMPHDAITRAGTLNGALSHSDTSTGHGTPRDEQPEQSEFLELVRSHLRKDPFVMSVSKRADASMFRWAADLLYRDELLYVPSAARCDALRLCHDVVSAGHFGRWKTLRLVQRSFWWPRRSQFVARYVRGCDTCARCKTVRHAPHGLLQPLPIPTRPWASIAMDFIVELPRSMGFDAILVVVDRFSKMAHFIPCRTSCSSVQTALLVLTHVVKLHGCPEDIVTDRGPQFRSRFWRELHARMGTTTFMSTAHHPQTDGQSERTNQTLEQYLRSFSNYQQDNWSQLLPMAEFAYNNSDHSATGVSPFFACYGYNPRSFTLLRQHRQGSNPAASARAEELRELHAYLHDELIRSGKSMCTMADRKRRPQPTFRVDDKVWLLCDAQHTSTRPSRKLDWKRLGPFVITAAIGKRAFRLALPPQMHVHPVFHVCRLERYDEPAFDAQRRAVSVPEIVDGHEELEVQAVLDSRTYRGRLQYLVDWVDQDPSERTWEPASHLRNASDVVHEFHARYPAKPRPARP